jgi:hypothetical protein
MACAFISSYHMKVSRMMILGEHAVHMEDMRGVYKILADKTKGKNFTVLILTLGQQL